MKVIEKIKLICITLYSSNAIKLISNLTLDHYIMTVYIYLVQSVH